PDRPRAAPRRRGRELPGAGGADGRHGRARAHQPRRVQPARQRAPLEPARRHRRGPAAQRHADRARPRAGVRAGRPPACLRALLPIRPRASDAGLGPRPGDRPPGGGGFFHGPGGPGVHSETVVPNKAGDGFITVTSDAGTVKSTSGNDVTIDESVGSLHYKDVTVTIPDGATIIRNHAKASLSDIAT